MPDNAPGSLHEMLQQKLTASFCGLNVGDKLPSDRELAKKYSIALLTVNKAMKQLELDGYVVRKHGSGTFLASHEKVVRRTGGVNGNIVIACPDYFSFEYWKRVRIAHELSLKNGMNLLELKIYEKSGPEHLLNTLSEQENLQGVLIDPVPGSLTFKTVRKLNKLGVPVVLFSHCPFIESTENISAVVPDWFDSGYQRAKLLLQSGRKKIALIHNEVPGKDNELSLKGICHALEEYGLTAKSLICPSQTGHSWEDARRTGMELTRKVWKRHKPQGIIYDSINGVFGGLRFFCENGIKVPQDVSMVSFGPSNGLDEYFIPQLTTVSSSLEHEVEAAFRHILPASGKCHEEKLTVCPVKAISRQSIAPWPID